MTPYMEGHLEYVDTVSIETYTMWRDSHGCTEFVDLYHETTLLMQPVQDDPSTGRAFYIFDDGPNVKIFRITGVSHDGNPEI